MNFAYATFIMNGNSYLEAAQVLSTSILNTNTLHPLIIMVTPDVSADARLKLLPFFHHIIEIPVIEYPCKPLITPTMNTIYGAWIEKSFTKLNVFKESVYPIKYDKILYLDADQVVLENLDHLFNLPTPALSFDSEFSNKYHGKGIYNPYKYKKHGDVIDYRSIAENFYNCIVGASGTMVLTPDDTFFQAAINILKNYQIYGHKLYNGFEEQLLAETFIHTKTHITHLSKTYSWCAGQYHALSNGKAAVVNYYGLEKPWLKQSNYVDQFVWHYFASRADEFKCQFTDTKSFKT